MGHEENGTAAAVEQALRDWLSRHAEGPLTEVHHWALHPPGKLLRPVLLLESAAAVGGAYERVMPAAVGVELVHVASLLHDDVLDDDRLRRGKPSGHARFGADAAVLAGDALMFALFEQVVECGRRGVPEAAVNRAVGLLARAGGRMARGVARELDPVPAPDVVGGYLEMVRLKTGALLSACCATGAVLGGGSPEQARALAGYGEALGVAFQIRDDLLPYGPEAGREGKPADSDLRNDRPSLPLLLAGPVARDPEKVGRLLVETGALAECTRLGRSYVERARRELEALPRGPHRAALCRTAEALAPGPWRAGGVG
ncbi:polyprenyl synthetase family protein [Streptomyces sp. NPDC086777]|uniref:polyprenyl synthetase family protein n=1 Tax=Streptomyces sp. NPDC086777 TaxID=3154866 RepID=UPI00344EB663